MADTPGSVQSRRREKAQLSCDFCRKRKLRCDRIYPCGACSSRGLQFSCSFPASLPVKSRDPSSVPPASIHGRLTQLEGLVVSLVQNLSAQNGQLPIRPILENNTPSINLTTTPGADLGYADVIKPSVASPNHESGEMHSIGSAGTTYVGSSHWMSILDSITELKDMFGYEEEIHDHVSPAFEGNSPMDADIVQSHTNGPELLYGCHQQISKRELIEGVPERRVVDRLVFAYFNDMNLPYELIHPATFLRRYHKFWQDPSAVSPIWLGLLYSIMCLATQFQLASAQSHDASHHQRHLLPLPQQTKPRYLEQVVQCLLLGDYSSGGPDVVELLLHYFAIERTRWPDSDSGNALLCGIVLRLALRMGYHRDPSHFPSITPFDGEMRRRVWMVLYSMDIMVSLQMGIPRMIKDGQWDTEIPRNLRDTDFDEDTAELPLSRSEREHTPLLSALAKYKLSLVLGQIVDWTMTAEVSVHPNLETDAKSLQEKLSVTYDSFGPDLKFTSLSDCLGHTAKDIIGRLSTTVLFLKGFIILHRRSIANISSTDGLDEVGSGSVQTCIDSALQILEYQSLIDTETKPGGALFSMRLMVSSTMFHEFLMATAVLCTYMFKTTGGDSNTMEETTNTKSVEGSIGLIEAALMRSYTIWLQWSIRSKEAKKAADVLSLLFTKLGILRQDQSPMIKEAQSCMDVLGDYAGFNFDMS